MHDYGATSEDFGLVTVADRRHAATNPRAWFYRRPVTLAEHQASRWIVEPLRLLDCCQESDGAVAVVVTSLERARDLRQPPAVIRAAAQGSGPDQYVMTSYYRDELGLPEMGVVARQLWRQVGAGPQDVRTAVLYDHFTPFVLCQLEELGFCGRGEARHFGDDRDVHLLNTPASIPHTPHGNGEHLQGVAVLVRRIVVREQFANVSGSGRAQHGIHDGMGDGIPVGMARQVLIVIQTDTAKNQRAGRGETMRVVTDANAAAHAAAGVGVSMGMIR